MIVSRGYLIGSFLVILVVCNSILHFTQVLDSLVQLNPSQTIVHLLQTQQTKLALSTVTLPPEKAELVGGLLPLETTSALP